MSRLATCRLETLLCLLLVWTPLLPCLAAGNTGQVRGTLALDPAHGIALPMRYKGRTRTPILAPDPPRAIVYLEREDRRYPDSPTPEPVEIRQEGYQFRPDIIAVRVGTQVAFPNRDDEFHSVFSYSPIKRFDLGRFRKDEPSPLIEFDQAGLAKVYCEIHKHMRSFVLVLETPWFTATANDGSFLLENIPPGDYRIRALLPSEEIREGRVTVRAGQTAQATFPSPR